MQLWCVQEHIQEGLICPSGCAIRGIGGWQTTFIGTTTATSDILRLHDDTTIQGLTFYVPADSNYNAVTYSGGGLSNTAAMYDIRFLGDGGGSNQGGGIYKSGPGKIIGAEIRFDRGGIGFGMKTVSGAIALEGIHIPPSDGSFNKVAVAEPLPGASDGGRLQLADFNSGNINVDDVLEISGNSTILVYGINAFNIAGSAVHIVSDGGTVGIYNGKIEHASTGVVFLVDDGVTGSGTSVQCTAANSGIYNFPKEAINTDFALAFLQEADNYNASTYQLIGTNLNVGLPEKGSQTFVGRGQPYSLGYTVLSYSGADPTDDGTFQDDVTLEASSTEEATFQFTTGNVNETICWSVQRFDFSDLSNVYHWGVEVDVFEGALNGEYMFELKVEDNSWVEVGVQAISISSTHKYSSDVFLRSNSIEEMRLGIYSDTSWNVTEMVNDGTPVEGRWARVRTIVQPTTPATGPVFNKWSITPSHTRFNADGCRTASGLSMWRKSIVGGGAVFSGQLGFAENSSVDVGAGAFIPTNTGWRQYFSGASLGGNSSTMMGEGTNNTIFYQFLLPQGLCTAYPLKAKVTYIIIDLENIATQLNISVVPFKVKNILVADPNGTLIPIPRIQANSSIITNPPVNAVIVEHSTPPPLHSSNLYRKSYICSCSVINNKWIQNKWIL